MMRMITCLLCHCAVGSLYHRFTGRRMFCVFAIVTLVDLYTLQRLECDHAKIALIQGCFNICMSCFGVRREEIFGNGNTHCALSWMICFGRYLEIDWKVIVTFI